MNVQNNGNLTRVWLVGLLIGAGMLAGLCAPAAGDWPYGCQETENVRCEGNGQICLPFAS